MSEEKYCKCGCVGTLGPNPECGRCGGDGTHGMSEDIKMGDVFELPVEICEYEDYKHCGALNIFDRSGSMIDSDLNSEEMDAVVVAINNHDRLTEHNAKLTADNKALVEALELAISTRDHFYMTEKQDIEWTEKARAALAQAKEPQS